MRNDSGVLIQSLKVTCISNVTLAELFSISALNLLYLNNEKKNPTLGQHYQVETSGMMEMSYFCAVQ